MAFVVLCLLGYFHAALGPAQAQEDTKPLSRIQERAQAEEQKFLELHADHFRPLDDINAILVNYSYDESLFPWIDKQEAVKLAVENVKAKLPPELRDRVAPVDENKAYSGLNVHLDFYVLSAPFKNYPYTNADYVALVTTGLTSYEATDGRIIAPSLEEKVEPRLRTIKDPSNFDERDRMRQIKRRLDGYTARLNKCLEEKSYGACLINDLGYFDIKTLIKVDIGPIGPEKSK